MTDCSRRRFLKTSVGAASLSLMGRQSLVSVLHADSFEHITGRIEPMPPATVRLSAGIFKDKL